MEIKRLELGFGQMNSYIIFDRMTKQAAIIDPGYDFEIINRFIEEENLEPIYILLTHSHGDHIGAVEDLKIVYPEIKLAIHEDEVEMLNDASLNLSKMLQGIEISHIADFTFKDGDKIKLADSNIEVLHTPGHSPGSSCFKLGREIIVGDTIFKLSIGRTDFYKGDFNQLIRSITEKLMVLPYDIILYPGHGPETTVGFERERNPFF